MTAFELASIAIQLKAEDDRELDLPRHVRRPTFTSQDYLGAAAKLLDDAQRYMDGPGRLRDVEETDHE